MYIRSSSKAKTLFIYPGSDNPYISVRGIKGQPIQAQNIPNEVTSVKNIPTKKPSRRNTLKEVNDKSPDKSRDIKTQQILSNKVKGEPDFEKFVGWQDDQPFVPRGSENKIKRKTINKDMRESRLQLDQLRQENKQLKSKVQSLESYFSRIGLMEPQLALKKENDNLNLKVLLQQQKISSLIYMIKQYRAGNKAESYQFQKKIAQFSPQLEKELTDKLSQANKTIQKTTEQLEFLRSIYEQCEVKNDHRLTWDRVLEKMRRLQTQKQGLQQMNGQLSVRLCECQSEVSRLKPVQEQLEKLRQEYQILLDQNRELKKQLQVIGLQLHNTKRKAEEYWYELSEKKALQSQLKDRNQVVKETTMKLARAQNQNHEVKGRLENFLKCFNQKIFQQKSVVERLGELFGQVADNGYRFFQTLQVMDENIGRQMVTFLEHLYKQNKQLYEEIINDFRREMEILYKQGQDSKKVVQSLQADIDQLVASQTKWSADTELLAHKLLKYIAQLQMTQTSCLLCQTFKGYHEQMRTILLQMFPQ